MTRYIQNPETMELVELPSRGDNAPSHLLMKNFVPFRSPIDGKIVSTRQGLLDHNKKHSVTQDGFADRIAARTAECENLFGGQYKDPTRKADIRDAIERCRGEGDNRYRYDD